MPFINETKQEGESVNEYVAQLRNLSKYCEFNAFLNDALRDKIVCGLRNVHIQKRLLSESELTLTKTRNKCRNGNCCKRCIRAPR